MEIYTNAKFLGKVELCNGVLNKGEIKYNLPESTIDVTIASLKYVDDADAILLEKINTKADKDSVYTKEEIENLGNVTYKGVIENWNEIPSNPQKGDVYKFSQTAVPETLREDYYICDKTETGVIWIPFGNTVGYSIKKYVGDSILNKADKATTLAGYGITDAYTKSYIDTNYYTKESIHSGVHTQTIFGYDPLSSSETNKNIYFDEDDGVRITIGDKDFWISKDSGSEGEFNQLALVSELNLKADQSTTYTKTEVDDTFVTKSNYNTLANDVQANRSYISSLNTGLSGAYQNIQLLSEEIDKLKSLQTDVESLSSSKADKSTTLSGYGITDSYTKTEVDELVKHSYKATNPELTPVDEISTWTINHGLNTEDVIVQIIDTETKKVVTPSIEITDENTVTVEFSFDQTISSGKYKIIILK